MDRWHLIWDILSEFEIDTPDCNELSDNLDAFINDCVSKERSKIIALIVSKLGLINDFGNVKMNGYCTWEDWRGIAK